MAQATHLPDPNEPHDNLGAPALPDADDEEAPAGFQQASGDIVAYWDPASPGKGPGKNGSKDPKFWYSEQHGFRRGSGPILFTPIDVVLSDSNLSTEDNPKTSTLLFGRLEKACKLRSANDEEGIKEFEPGALIGIWTKPGMKPLGRLAGTKVWMRNGQKINEKLVMFKDIKKPSPMVLFDIMNEKPGKPLPVREDRRVVSLPQKEKDRRAALAAAAASAPEAEDLGDIPF